MIRFGRRPVIHWVGKPLRPKTTVTVHPYGFYAPSYGMSLGKLIWDMVRLANL